MAIKDEKRKARKLLSSEERIIKHKALHKAKEIENKKIPTAKQELKEMEQFIDESEDAKKLLKPQWYLKKTDIEKKEKSKKINKE